MPGHGPLEKPTMSQLALMVYCADNPDAYYVSTGGMYASCHLADPGKMHATENPVAPKVKKNMAFHRLLQSGWFETAPADDRKWHFMAHPYKITEAGIEMANKHRAKLESHLAREAKRKAAVDRLVVISNLERWSVNKRKYAALVRVVKETKKRLYIERVLVQGERDNYISSIEGGRGRGSHGEYVSKDKVVADGVTVEEYQAMRRVEKEKIEWLAGIRKEEETEIQAIRERFNQRREQQEHMYEDELREALAKVKSNGKS